MPRPDGGLARSLTSCGPIRIRGASTTPISITGATRGKLELLGDRRYRRAHHDLFGNVGYALEREETMRGVKETVEFEILISLFRRA